MKTRRGLVMFVVGLILALCGLAGPQVFGPHSAQATTTGCANFGAGDLFGCLVSGTSNSYAFRSDNAGTGGNAKGLFGYASGTSGTNFGVYGLSASSSGYGVYGSNSAATGGIGVYGAAGDSGAGVFGLNNGISGVAVRGQTASTSGTGVSGSASASSGITYGVFGSSVSTSGTGVYGVGNNIGVLGAGASNSSPSYGIYGSTNSSTGNWAGYFAGNVHVNGTLSKSAGSFKIDHPLDPANKYLSHSFVESPDMLNIYNGNVTLDARGQAVVELPAYFEALNQDFRYQLTAIGAPGPNLYIAEKIKGNRFKIAGGKPGTEVSWQVTGVRHDPYAQQHRIEVEQDKPAEEIGTYLYPLGYGQPETKGRDYKELQRLDATRLVGPDRMPAP